MEPETEPGSAVQPEEVHDDAKVRLGDLLEFARLIRAELDQASPEQRESALQGEVSTNDIRCFTRTVASASAASSSIETTATVVPRWRRGSVQSGAEARSEEGPYGGRGAEARSEEGPYGRGRSILAELLREVGNKGAGRVVPD